MYSLCFGIAPKNHVLGKYTETGLEKSNIKKYNIT